MKRGTVVGLAVAGVLVLGVGAAVVATALGGDSPTVTAAQTSESSNEPDAGASGATEAEPDQKDAAAKGDETAAAESVGTSPGAYIDYSEEALAAAEGKRVLYFHADWCPTCRALEDDIEAAGVPEGITILKVNYDTEQALKQKYDVVQQTTMVLIDDDGNAVKSYVPYESPTLSAVLLSLDLS